MTLEVDRMCCGEQNGWFRKRKARNFGVCALLLFVLLPGPLCGRRPPCRREQSCRVRGFTYRLGRDVADCLCQLPVPTACADCPCRLPVPTARADCCGRLPGPTCRTRLRAGPDAAGGRLVELVLDEELDGLVFCHSEFVVEDCGVVVSLLCAEPEFSLI